MADSTHTYDDPATHAEVRALVTRIADDATAVGENHGGDAEWLLQLVADELRNRDEM